jgi:5-methylcytosine-specific restriction endonuclease McrA
MAEPMHTRVQQRAQHACEYCRLPQRASLLPHQIDHIIAQQHMGSDEESNLCLCCLRCNLKKGPNIASTDPEAGSAYRIVALFHPRKQRWHTHFQLREDGRIEGVTREGRATARLLDFNAEERVQLRRLLMQQGWRP